MKLKKYIQFIKESLKEDLDSGKIWELNEDQIREYLIELDDAGYLIVVNFGFVKKHTINYYNKPSVEKDVYTENIVAGEEIRPAYWIEIQKSKDVNNEDVTDSLKFACSIIEDEVDADIKLYDTDTDVDINTTLIKGGIFINVDPEDNMSGEEANNYISIFAKQRNTIKIKPTDLEDYYGWDVKVKKEEQLWAEMELEDLADFILSPRSDYKDSLVKGQEHMWDYYELSSYYPEGIYTGPDSYLEIKASPTITNVTSTDISANVSFSYPFVKPDSINYSVYFNNNLLFTEINTITYYDPVLTNYFTVSNLTQNTNYNVIATSVYTSDISYNIDSSYWFNIPNIYLFIF
jgi:hypothetical protein